MTLLIHKFHLSYSVLVNPKIPGAPWAASSSDQRLTPTVIVARILWNTSSYIGSMEFKFKIYERRMIVEWKNIQLCTVMYSRETEHNTMFHMSINVSFICLPNEEDQSLHYITLQLKSSSFDMVSWYIMHTSHYEITLKACNMVRRPFVWRFKCFLY